MCEQFLLRELTPGRVDEGVRQEEGVTLFEGRVGEGRKAELSCIMYPIVSTGRDCGTVDEWRGGAECSDSLHVGEPPSFGE
jgi:hypothetical protein